MIESLTPADIKRNYYTTLSAVSRDSTKRESLINSELPAINFDSVVRRYRNLIRCANTPASNDALILVKRTSEVFFIEFKNSTLLQLEDEECRHSLCNKIRDSVIIFCDLFDKAPSYLRTQCTYILVFSPDNSREKLIKHIADKSDKTFNFFGLKSMFERYCFKNVLTVTSEQFLNLIETGAISLQ